MKKTLLATTAIVALGGAASAAEVSLSGYAEIGLQGGDAVDTQFHDDFDVSFSLSGETDNGLTFGAKIDLDEVSGGISNRGSANAVFISGAFGTLTMGDTDSAFDKAMIDVGALTSLADDHTSHIGYSGNSYFDGVYDGQILRYDYSFGDVTASLSVELCDNTCVSTTSGSPVVTDGDAAVAIGFNWSGDLGGMAVGVGVAHLSFDANTGSGSISETGISASVGIGSAVSVVVNYTDFDTGAGPGFDHTGIGVTYSVDALSVHANWGEFSGSGGSASGVGFAVNYDLGGGAVVMLGYGSSDSGFGGSSNGNGDDTWSLGLGLSF